MKKKLSLLAVALMAVASIFACNKQKAPRLDYTSKMKQGLFSPNGMPGDNHIGATDEEKKFKGYDVQAKAVSASQGKKTEAKEAKPAPEQVKKPEAKEAKPAPEKVEKTK